MSKLETRTDIRASQWLAVALAIAPLLQLLSLDFDRTTPLLLLAPALLVGRRRLAEVWDKLWSTRGSERWLVLWLAGAGLAATAWSPHTAASAAMAAAWVYIAASALLAGQLVRVEPRAAGWILGGLAVGGALGSGLVFLLWPLHPMAFPVYFHHRHLGYHALLAAIACTALLVRLPRTARLRAGLWFAAGIVIWGGLFWSGGRAPVLAIGLALAAWCWRTDPPSRRRLIFWAGTQALAGLLWAQIFVTPEPYLGWWNAAQRTVELTDVNTASSARSQFWPAAWHHFLQSPWLGYGPDAYQFLTPKLDGQQPHNLVLQVLLDFGLLGAPAALAAVALALKRGWTRPRLATGQPENVDRWPWAALLTAGTAAGLVDGLYYHTIALVPIALAMGVCGGMTLEPRPPASRNAARYAGSGGMVMLGAATVVAALHSWLYFEVRVAPPPAGPDAPAARILHWFPSTTSGLSRWLIAWADPRPDDTLAWALWVQSRTPDAALYHIQAARLYMRRGDRARADQQLQDALATAHALQRPAVQAMIDDYHRPAPTSP